MCLEQLDNFMRTLKRFLGVTNDCTWNTPEDDQEGEKRESVARD